MRWVRAAALAGVLAICASVGARAQEDDIIIDQDRPDRRAPGADAAPPPEADKDTGRVDSAVAYVAPFVLRDLRVEGSSLPPAAFEPAVAPLRGQRIDGEDLRGLAQAVSRIYARTHVALYTILVPEQDFADGVVRLAVIEGHVNQVALSGDTRGDIGVVRHYAAALTAERPLSRARMERSLSLISDVPGLAAQVRMAPARERGGVVLGLGLTQQRFEYALDINNRGSDQLGHTRLQASLIANALFRLGDRTRLDIGADSEFDRYDYLALSHRQPIGFDGMAITGRISALETDPPNGVRGSARAAGIILTYPIIRAYRRNLIVSAGLDGVNSENAFLGDVFASERTRVLRAAFAYSHLQRPRTLRVNASLSQGLKDLGARVSDPSTDLDFTKLSVQAGYDRSFGARWAVRLAAGGQVSDNALPASERFTLGGSSFGRAFDAAELGGDQAVGASAELGWRGRRQDGFHIAELYGFADGGQVWRADRPGAPGVTRDLASAGVGARLGLGRESVLELEAAKSVDEPLPDADPRGWRLRVGVNVRF